MAKYSNISTIEEVKDTFKYLIETRQLAFHPDDSFDQYICNATGEPTFTADECEHFDMLMDQCFDVCEKDGVDIYELAMELSPLFQYI